MLFGNVVRVCCSVMSCMCCWCACCTCPCSSETERITDGERATERLGKSDRETRKEQQRDEERATERLGKSDREMRKERQRDEDTGALHACALHMCMPHWKHCEREEDRWRWA